MKKLKIIISIAFLTVLSVIVGFITALTNKPLTPRDEYPLLAITGTIAVIIVLGLMFWGVYALCKKNDNPNAFNIAFWVYTFFAFCLMGVGMYKFPEALKKRDRYEFMYFYEARIERLVHNKVSLQLSLRNDLNEETKEDIESCVSMSVRYDDKLIDRMMKARTIEEFFLHDSALKAEINQCIDLYSE
jgi:hypothetical protein